MSTNTNSTDKPNKVTAKDLDSGAIAGIKKYLSSIPKITLGGVDYTPQTLTGALQAEIDAITSVDAVRAQFSEQVANTKKVRGNTRALRALLRKYILATYGVGALQMLGDFGMNVPKPIGPRKAEAKAASAVKARATRKAKKDALEALSKPAATPVIGVVVPVSTTPAKQ